MAAGKLCKHLELTLAILRRLIISSEKTSIYILSTFPNALTSKRAQNHEITGDKYTCIFFNKFDVALCHAPT